MITKQPDGSECLVRGILGCKGRDTKLMANVTMPGRGTHLEMIGFLLGKFLWELEFIVPSVCDLVKVKLILKDSLFL